MNTRRCFIAIVTLCFLSISPFNIYAAIYTGGQEDGYCMGAMTNDVNLGGAVVTISSGSNQSFARGYGPVSISAITITDDTPPGITNGTRIVVRIPADLVMTWDETDLTATFGGTASNKVGTISYTSGNKHLVINVTNDFAGGDTLTISDLSFKNYLGSGTARLELDFDNDGLVDGEDDKAISILSAFHYGGIDDSFAECMTIGDRALNAGTIIMLK